MKKLLKKDNYNRQVFKKNQHIKIILKSIFKNTFFFNDIKWKALFLISLINRKSSVSLIRHCCIYTGRKSSINKKFRFSRLVLLKISRLNLLSGLYKLYW